MNREQILSTICSLAYSQGFYGRLYEYLTDGSDSAEKALDKMGQQNFGDLMDLIMWLES